MSELLRIEPGPAVKNAFWFTLPIGIIALVLASAAGLFFGLNAAVVSTGIVIGVWLFLVLGSGVTALIYNLLAKLIGPLQGDIIAHETGYSLARFDGARYFHYQIVGLVFSLAILGLGTLSLTPETTVADLGLGSLFSNASPSAALLLSGLLTSLLGIALMQGVIAWYNHAGKPLRGEAKETDGKVVLTNIAVGPVAFWWTLLSALQGVLTVFLIMSGFNASSELGVIGDASLFLGLTIITPLIAWLTIGLYRFSVRMNAPAVYTLAEPLPTSAEAIAAAVSEQPAVTEQRVAVPSTSSPTDNAVSAASTAEPASSSKTSSETMPVTQTSPARVSARSRSKPAAKRASAAIPTKKTAASRTAKPKSSSAKRSTTKPVKKPVRAAAKRAGRR